MDSTQHIPGDLTTLLAAAGIGTWSWDPSSGKVHWDETTKRIYGVLDSDFAGTFEEYASLIHPDDLADVTELVASLADHGGDYTTKHRIVHPSGTIRWVEGQGHIEVVDQMPIAGYGVVYDVTDRSSVEQERDRLRIAERAADAARTATEQDLALLIEASDSFSGALNIDRILDRLASLISPTLSDRCTIDFQKDALSGQVTTAVADSDHRLVSVARVDRTVEARLTHASGAVSSEELALLAPLSSRPDETSGMMIPLTVRGSRIGNVLVERDTAAWPERSLALVTAICRRAAVALDNASLFQEQATVTNLLVRSVRPATLHVPDGFEVASHYQAATEISLLGGDFYDCFSVHPTRSIAVVGDFTGKGIVAAAQAGLVRSAVHAAALASGDIEATIRTINAMLRSQSNQPYASLVVAGIESRPDGSRHYAVSSAGHPPPVVVRSDGSTDEVQVQGLLLGFAANAEWPTKAGVLDPGDTLLMYSDGVIEARLGTEEFGADRLRSTASAAAATGCEAIAKAVASALDAWTAGKAQDDITLLAISAR